MYAQHILRRALTVLVAVTTLCTAASTGARAQDAARSMTFLDVRHMRSVSAPTPSPDGQWMLYTLSTPDWKEAKIQTDVYLVSTRQGLPSTRQMTFTREKNEASPRWAADGKAFFFLSNREAPENAATRNQLYMMRPDGGEAQRLTDAREGVRDYQISRDGKWLVYRSGKDNEEQLYRLPTAGIETAKAEQITKHDTGVGTWRFAPDTRRIYFLAPDRVDKDEKDRREKKFTVNIRNMETPSASLWALVMEDNATKKLSDGAQYAVTGFTISGDSKWVGFRGQSLNRYQRNITSESLYADLSLVEAATGNVERLTNNVEVSESELSFSPDGRWMAYTSADDSTRYTMSNSRLYLRAVADRGKPFRKLGTSFDGDVGIAFWAKDASAIYFNEGIKATNQLMALDLKTGTVGQVTSEKAAVSVNVHDDTGVVLITYSDPQTPTMIHVVEGDPRVPSPQSVELHMALKQLGVPTELFMYPGNTHGIPDPRNQFVKSVSEMAWMDYYVRGIGSKFSWRDVLKTLEDAPPAAKPATTSQQQ
jgi:dipeptidyl aminopeptidase/acylaminoacyl peptidase